MFRPSIITQHRIRARHASAAMGVFFAALSIGIFPIGYACAFMGAFAVNVNIAVTHAQAYAVGTCSIVGAVCLFVMLGAGLVTHYYEN